MIYQYTQRSLKTAVHTMLQFSLLLTCLLSANGLRAESVYAKVIEVTLGDYRYMPGHIQLIVDQPVVLHLVNVDSFTPHNFTLEDASDGLDVNVDIPASFNTLFSRIELAGLWAGVGYSAVVQAAIL